MDAKAKLNLKEGIIELEGNEEFVKKYLDEFKGLLNKTSQYIPQQFSPDKKIIQTISSQTQQNNNLQQGIKQKYKQKMSKGNITPIPMDLKTKTPSLRELYQQKKPFTNQEIVALFVYYINKILTNDNVAPGHILSCYNEIGIKKPLDIPSIFRDIIRYKGWISANGDGTAHITIAGENLIEQDLPRKENVKQSQSPVTN